MKGCDNCGLRVDNTCFVNGRVIKEGDHELFKDCSYFIEPVIEDGKIMEPKQLLLISRNEIARRR